MDRKARIALLSFRLESNFHAPTVLKSDFVPQSYFAGETLGGMLEKDDPRLPKELIGFKQTMDGLREWELLPIVAAGTGPGGPVDQKFFDEMKAEMESRLKEALPLDAVYFAEHGAATATEETDPDGVLFAMAREIAGPQAAIVASLDLHANVNTRMLGAVDMLCSFLTNPHVDQYERGQESARAIDEMLKGQKTAKALAKLPMMSPSTSLNTKFGPYGDLIARGQEEAQNPKVMNVSISAGFASGDTPKAGMAIAVTTRDDLDLAREIAGRLAKAAWSDRRRYTISLTPIPEAVDMMLKAAQDPSLPALLFADPADNPGGGGRGNTTYVLKAMLEADVQGALLGCMFDAPLAAKALELGVGAKFTCTFNSQETNRFSEKLTCEAEVLGLQDEPIIGRRGVRQGSLLDLGPSALLGIGGVKVVVISQRVQCCDPMMIERFGIDLRSLRSLIVKSRGHFRAGFDDIFADEQILEIDAPGLTTPVLSRVPYKNVPRPIYPLDPDMTWEPQVS